MKTMYKKMAVLLLMALPSVSMAQWAVFDVQGALASAKEYALNLDQIVIEKAKEKIQGEIRDLQKDIENRIEDGVNQQLKDAKSSLPDWLNDNVDVDMPRLKLDLDKLWAMRLPDENDPAANYEAKMGTEAEVPYPARVIPAFQDPEDREEMINAIYAAEPKDRDELKDRLEGSTRLSGAAIENLLVRSDAINKKMVPAYTAYSFVAKTAADYEAKSAKYQKGALVRATTAMQADNNTKDVLHSIVELGVYQNILLEKILETQLHRMMTTPDIMAISAAAEMRTLESNVQDLIKSKSDVDNLGAGSTGNLVNPN